MVSFRLPVPLLRFDMVPAPSRPRLWVSLRGAGVTFKADGQERGDAGGGGAAPGLGWGAGRPLGGRGGGGGS